MIKACVFDIGGTIFDRYSLSPVMSLKHAFAMNKIKVSSDIILQDMGLRKSEHIVKILKKPEIVSQWKNREPGIYKKKMLRNIIQDFNSQQTVNIFKRDIIPETKQVIQRLQDKNIIVALTTGFDINHTTIIHNILQENGITIPHYVSSSCVKNSRPYPDMITSLLHRMNTHNVKQIIKIDDTSIGIEEGKNIGCWTVGVARWSSNMNMYDDPEETDFNIIQEKLQHSRNCLKNADFVIDTLDQLPIVIEGLNSKLLKK